MRLDRGVSFSRRAMLSFAGLRTAAIPSITAVGALPVWGSTIGGSNCISAAIHGPISGPICARIPRHTPDAYPTPHPRTSVFAASVGAGTAIDQRSRREILAVHAAVQRAPTARPAALKATPV